MAFDRGEIALQSKIRIRLAEHRPPTATRAARGLAEGEPLLLETTLGRALFNETLPADYAYVNYEVGKKQLGVDRQRPGRALHQGRGRRTRSTRSRTPASTGPPAPA